MVHDTPARQEARALKEAINNLTREAAALEDMGGLEAQATARRERAKELRQEADELQERARLEDLSVRQEALVKQTKKCGERTYYRWVASWREGDKIRKVYLGSCKKMSEGEALQKARKMKAAELGIEARGGHVVTFSTWSEFNIE